MDINFDYYKTFYFVGKYGGFTQAAKALHNNQPNITRIINNLEAELNCKLFLRSRKGVSLTPEGKKLYLHIESAYKQIKSGEAELEESASLNSGSISLAISEIALHGFMLPVLQEYRLTFPGIRIKILNHSTPEGLRALSRGDAELAIISSPTELPNNMKSTKVINFKEILIAGKLFSELKNKKLDIKDISTYPIITLGKNTASYNFLKDFFYANGTVFEPSVEAATTDQILPMVAHDIGLGFVPKNLAANVLASGDVFQVKVSEKIPERSICLVRDKSKPLSAAASALETLILKKGASQ